jgi:hypothetical protein
MPPTIIVTVGRLALEPLELDAPPPAAAADELLLPDEQAATVTTVAQAAARAASEPLRMVLSIGATPLTRYEGKEDRRDKEEKRKEEGGERGVAAPEGIRRRRTPWLSAAASGAVASQAG